MDEQIKQTTTDETNQVAADEMPTAKLPWTTPVLQTVEVEETATKDGSPNEDTPVGPPS